MYKWYNLHGSVSDCRSSWSFFNPEHRARTSSNSDPYSISHSHSFDSDSFFSISTTSSTHLALSHFAYSESRHSDSFESTTSAATDPKTSPCYRLQFHSKPTCQDPESARYPITYDYSIAS